MSASSKPRNGRSLSPASPDPALTDVAREPEPASRIHERVPPSSFSRLATADAPAQLPGPEDPERESQRREARIVQTLLLQVHGMSKVTLDKIVAAGLATLPALSSADPEELATATGVPEALGAVIVESFRPFGSREHAWDARDREQIEQLVVRLRAQQGEFERASQAWTGEASRRKKELREERARTILEIELHLARLGEIEALEDVEQLPFARKLDRLEAFLLSSRDKYRDT